MLTWCGNIQGKYPIYNTYTAPIIELVQRKREGSNVLSYINSQMSVTLSGSIYGNVSI